MDIHLEAFLIALLGMALQVTLKIYSMKTKAAKANVRLTVIEYFKQEWLVLLASIIAIGIFTWLIEDITAISHRMIHYVKFFMAFVGYTGADVLLRLFSVVNKKLNNIIDQKTNQADMFKASGVNTLTNLNEGTN